MLLAGCTTTQTPAPTPIAETSSVVACAAFMPITYSRKDTPGTKEQIVSHNGAYRALCHRETK